MKKFLSVGLISAAILSFAFAQAIEPTQEDGYISVNANLTEEIEPNQAVVTFSVETENKDIQKVTDSLNDLSAKLTEALKAKIGEEDVIKTTTYSVNPIYQQKDKKRVFLGYRANTKMIVTTKNIDKLSSIISTALNNGAMEVNGLNFTSTNNNEICNELLAKAAKQAKENADVVAKSIETSVVGIKNLSTSCGVQSSSSRAYALNAKAAFGSAEDAAVESMSTPTIEPGTIKINANVYGNFYVK